ncbi:hypothetical protein DTO271D3_5905 [Paecilomyces variotii]|nr:hypothetical protein DTO271D3_5905 [Paecilomyces variotii]
MRMQPCFLLLFCVKRDGGHITGGRHDDVIDSKDPISHRSSLLVQPSRRISPKGTMPRLRVLLFPVKPDKPGRHQHAREPEGGFRLLVPRSAPALPAPCGLQSYPHWLGSRVTA